MKTIFYILIISLLFTSCKKTYTCDCSYTFDWGDGTTTEESFSFEIPKSRKKDAQATCDKYAEDQTNWKYSYECNLN